VPGLSFCRLQAALQAQLGPRLRVVVGVERDVEGGVAAQARRRAVNCQIEVAPLVVQDHAAQYTEMRGAGKSTGPCASRRSYFFFLDFEGHIEDTDCARLVRELRKKTTFLKVLGSYPAWTGQEASN
jgi:hypothetical protein